jgi:predicted dehydrogenase
MTALIRVGLIGCGGIGQAHAAAAADCPGAVLAGVADARTEAVESTAATYGTEVVPVEALLDRDRFDLVVVASPPATHTDVVEPLLRAGVPVICEKPLEVDLAAARKLVAVASETGTPMTMAAKFRFVPDINHARELVQGGAIGKLVKVEVSFAGCVDMSRRWNADRTISGGGVLIDNATHGVDLVRYLAGPLAAVLAVEGPRAQQVTVEDSATLLAHTSSGALAQVDVTWSFRRLSSTYLSLFGTAGTVEVGWGGGRATTVDQPGGYDFGTGYNKINSLRANLRAVLDALAAGGPMPVSLADALAAAAAVEAGYLSLGRSAWVPVEEQP